MNRRYTMNYNKAPENINIMILAAGLGTRLKPLTDVMPKALVPVSGKPLLRHLLEKIITAFPRSDKKIVINVHHFAEQIIDYLKANNNFGLNISISDETGQLLETGGALKKAATLFSNTSPILIHNVDIFSNVDLAKFYEQGKANAATLLVSNRETSRYLYFDTDDNLIGWKNIKTGEYKGICSPFPDSSEFSRMAFSGIHIISPQVFKYFDRFPDRFSIIDFYLSICREEQIKCVVKDDLMLLDVGKLDSLHAAEDFLNLNPQAT